MFILVIFFIIFLVLIWYSFIFEPYNFKIEKITFDIKNLPSFFNGLKIVQLSDIHSKHFGCREKKVLTMVNNLNPDYIFITGDIIDTKTKDLKSCRDFWQELVKQCPDRIFAIFGNHIHRNKKINVHSFKKILQECGINVLVNENRRLERNGKYIYLIGVDDPRTKHHDFEKAMQGVDKNIVKILLAHSVSIIEDLKPKEVDLILTGHTHGAQVRLPLIPNFWVPTRYHGKYISGIYNIKSIPVYINRGIGTDLLPIRFNSAPEITLIELRKK